MLGCGVEWRAVKQKTQSPLRANTLDLLWPCTVKSDKRICPKYRSESRGEEQSGKHTLISLVHTLMHVPVRTHTDTHRHTFTLIYTQIPPLRS